MRRVARVALRCYVHEWPMMYDVHRIALVDTHVHGFMIAGSGTNKPVDLNSIVLYEVKKDICI